jgi:catechol 2,3-dioxygenase-like lactoylglutathione lyase family enzyme
MATAVKALGEIALRVNDLDKSQVFYEKAIGLELMKRFDHAAFFRIADGYGGHTAILALFDRSIPVAQASTTIDHVAFTIALEDFEAEKRRFEALGLAVSTTTHAWVHWRSLYVRDPDGNNVEFVCFDSDV